MKMHHAATDSKSIDAARDISLELILRSLGARADAHDSHKWHTDSGVLSVNGHKFMNWNQGIGGGGAIDLTMHMLDCDFKQALEWLARHAVSLASATNKHERVLHHTSLTLPQHDESKLQRVISYLHVQRAIPLPLIQSMIRQGMMYADSCANAVFLLRGKNSQVVGAELRGTSQRQWRGMAVGSRKDAGAFYLHATATRKAILCESAIDALSCFALDSRYWAFSTAGARSNPEWLTTLIQREFDISCGFDADETGDAMAQMMIERYPMIKRLRPQCHDWNEVLRATSVMRL